jgi:hypothetical protein
VATKAKDEPTVAVAFAGGKDEKLTKIVGEVDRFFKSVHADIEDWKFSMEEYGEGTRIFVRFQLHINKAEPRPGRNFSKKPIAKLEVVETAEPTPRLPSVPAPSPERALAEGGHASEAAGAASRADLDLASFVEMWRSKPDQSKTSEFHKEGAPYMDSESAPKTGKKRGAESTPDPAPERAHEKAKVSTAAK